MSLNAAFAMVILLFLNSDMTTTWDNQKLYLFWNFSALFGHMYIVNIIYRAARVRVS